MAYQSRARELMQLGGMQLLGTSLSKKEDRLAEAATLMLKSGNFKDYCEIQMQLGKFEDAIAYAPKVSLEFWRECIDKYQQKLQYEESSLDNPADELAQYQILIGQQARAVETLENAGQTKDALLVKAVKVGGGYLEPDAVARHQPNKSVVKSEADKTF